MYDRLEATRGYFHTTDAEAFRDFCRHHGIQLPYKNELCSTCNGEGSQALHGLVISEEDQQDHEFMEEYMDGKYDTPCDDCKGRRVVKVPNMERMTEEQRKDWKKWLRGVHSANAESLMEMRAGC